jgi:DNA-binding NarL/FixJ family response regulator
MDDNRKGSDPGSIRILIVDDRAQVRESLQALLETEDGLLVVGQARDGREAVARCAAVSPGVVLMDLEMPGMGGLAATRLLSGHANCPAVIILTVHAAPWWQAQATRAGASAFVSKTDHPARIIQAIRQAAAARVSPERPGTCFTN